MWVIVECMLREYGLDNIYVTTQNDTVYALLSDRALADPDDLIAQWKDERTRQWNDVYAGEMLAQVRSVAKRSNTKIQIIQAIDRQADLDELADSLGLEFDEFLTELESIVEAGTKIDIRYFIDEILDDDQQEDLNSYFMELEEDDIELAIQELGADYDEETIRLARVKFISDMGN